MSQDPFWRLLAEPGVSVTLGFLVAYARIVFADWLHETGRLP